MTTINDTSKEFATASIGKLFGKYATTGALGLLFVGMQTMIDGAFLGRYASEQALAAVNIVMPIYTLITAISIIIGIGCQTIVGISLGQGNYTKASDAIKTAFISLMVISVMLSSLVYLFRESIIYILGNSDELRSLATDYLIRLAPFYPFIALFFLGDYILKVLGRPIFAMSVLISTVIINIIFDYIFIAKLSLGTSGAAYATGLAFTIAALAVAGILFKNNRGITIQKGKYQNRLFAKMIYNGSSEGIAELSAGITILMFNNAMIYYIGADGVAAYTFINYLMYIGIIIFVGISDGIIPIISYNYGSGNITRVFKIFRSVILLNGIIGFAFALISYFGAEHICNLFFDKIDPTSKLYEVIRIGSKISAIAFLFNGANIAIAALFTAMGDARTSAIISLLRGLIFIAVGISIYPTLLGINGIWLTVPIAEIATIIFASALLNNRKSKIVYQLRNNDR